MPGCSAFGCSNRTDQGYRLFRFPSDPVRRAVWAANVRRDKWTPTNTNQLCEVHFEDDQFEMKRLDGRKLLKFDAVPTIFNHRPVYKRRKPPSNHISEECQAETLRIKRVKVEHSYHRQSETCQTIQEPCIAANRSTVFNTNRILPETAMTSMESFMDVNGSLQFAKYKYHRNSSSSEITSTELPALSSSSSVCNKPYCVRKSLKLQNLHAQYSKLKKTYKELRNKCMELQKQQWQLFSKVTIDVEPLQCIDTKMTSTLPKGWIGCS